MSRPIAIRPKIGNKSCRSCPPGHLSMAKLAKNATHKTTLGPLSTTAASVSSKRVVSPWRAKVDPNKANEKLTIFTDTRQEEASCFWNKCPYR